MWYLYLLCAIVGFSFGGLLVLFIFDLLPNDKQEEYDTPFLQLSHIAINFMEDYHELEKQNNELKERLKKYETDSHDGGVVPPSKPMREEIKLKCIICMNIKIIGYHAALQYGIGTISTTA